MAAGDLVQASVGEKVIETMYCDCPDTAIKRFFNKRDDGITKASFTLKKRIWHLYYHELEYRDEPLGVFAKSDVIAAIKADKVIAKVVDFPVSKFEKEAKAHAQAGVSPYKRAKELVKEGRPKSDILLLLRMEYPNSKAAIFHSYIHTAMKQLEKK